MTVASNSHSSLVIIWQTLSIHTKVAFDVEEYMSSWNSFVRVYDNQLRVPKYSSLVVGVWDTLTQAGGGNTELFGVYKTESGVICVGRQIADNTGIPQGNNLPVIGVPSWGSTVPENESALLIYYSAANLYNSNDGFSGTFTGEAPLQENERIAILPNPVSDWMEITTKEIWPAGTSVSYTIFNALGQPLQSGRYQAGEILHIALVSGVYWLQMDGGGRSTSCAFIVKK